ncbi:MAG: hypothetical protein K9M98_06935 [Cephaloticoccus sp.]|nr:hypothetical protein [Cephaloticoccus sp.]MCF7760224.1 hypothetical protein [Cephaloticoccus sp.]
MTGVIDSTPHGRKTQTVPPTHMSTPPSDRLAARQTEAIAAAGGSPFEAALAVIAGFPAAVCPNLRPAAGHNAALRAQEATALKAWAVQTNHFHDGDTFDRRWREQGEMGGSENDIYYEEASGLVWKRNRIEVFCLSWRQFFDRILLHDFLFPEAPLRFEGVLEHEGALHGVCSQPDIVAKRGAWRDETETMMQARGYRRRSNDDYEGLLLLVEDLHEGNVLVDENGRLIVIDPAIFPR